MESRYNRSCLCLAAICIVGCNAAPPAASPPPVRGKMPDPASVPPTAATSPEHDTQADNTTVNPVSAAPVRNALTGAGQLEVIAEGYRLKVTDGEDAASLNINASEIKKLTHLKEDGAIQVDYETADACVENRRSRTFSYAFLKARLENKKALRHHRRQRFGEAARSRRGATSSVTLQAPR